MQKKTNEQRFEEQGFSHVINIILFAFANNIAEKYDFWQRKWFVSQMKRSKQKCTSTILLI